MMIGMEPSLLNVANAEQYSGQYVALTEFEGGEVIAGHADAREVLAEARRKGFPDPVLVYVPEKDAVLLY